MLHEGILVNIDNCKTRKKIRKYLINLFLKEEPGTGKGEKTSQYIYDIKTNCGYRLHLFRPAIYNKGMDFVIKVDNYLSNTPRNKKLTAPTHYNVLNDLKNKKQANLQEYNKLKQQINNIFYLKPYNTNMKFSSTGIPVPLLLEIIKWFFIEQDITYWNYSGRSMLKEEIDKI